MKMNFLNEVSEGIVYVGVNDRKTTLFEKYIPISNGVSYNSYLFIDTKTCLMDTVEFDFTREFLTNIKHALAGRELDYLVVHHMEPDHCAAIEEVLLRYPNVTIVSNQAVFKMLGQFFSFEIKNKLVVKENDILDLGKHQLKFIMAPFVHWPEVMFSYELNTKTLFSADAFGSFGALSGNLYYDEVNDPCYLNEARRYYTNIVGKYGQNVLNVFKKLQNLEILTICPLHGYLWRKDIPLLLKKYQKWASYEAEDREVVLIYASMYGNTEEAANILANYLAKQGLKNIKAYDVSLTDKSYLISEIFRVSHLVFLAPTYNNATYPNLNALLTQMENLNVSNKTVALVENGTWCACAGKLISCRLEGLKNMTILPEKVTIKSSLTEKNIEELEALALAIKNSL